MPFNYPNRRRASQTLIACCAVWAFSFPAMKSLALLGNRAAPGNGSFFFAALCVAERFTFASLLLLCLPWLRLPQLNWSETRQGLGLGIFGAAGLILQMDGMAYTHASTAAFLTQGYCVWIPLWFALRHSRLPSSTTLGATGLVLAGAAILNDVGSVGFRLGRGELENLLGSVFFAAQILWLERREFSGNHVGRFSLVMFLTMAAICGPLALVLADHPRAVITAYSSAPALILMAGLTVFCTLLTFLLANRWQPEVPATEAGLLYCTEPVFTFGVALFLPGLIARWTGIEYANEVLSWNLLAGGGLILAANVWMQLQPAPKPE
jgi:drug/metabolite transporter (DMT)-like permease